MTPFDRSEAGLIEMSRYQMLIFESPYDRHKRLLMDGDGMTEEQAEAFLDAMANETTAAEYQERKAA